MEINIAKSAGFCFGVQRAVDTVYRESAKKNVYTYGPIIHNDEVVADLERQGRICVEQRKYRNGDAEDADLVLAASDSREVNRAVHAECRERGIPVNVADDKNLCDFYFPSVVMTEEVVVGINSGGTDPGKVKETRKSIEKTLLEKNT